MLRSSLDPALYVLFILRCSAFCGGVLLLTRSQGRERSEKLQGWPQSLLAGVQCHAERLPGTAAVFTSLHRHVDKKNVSQGEGLFSLLRSPSTAEQCHCFLSHVPAVPSNVFPFFSDACKISTFQRTASNFFFFFSAGKISAGRKCAPCLTFKVERTHLLYLPCCSASPL